MLAFLAPVLAFLELGCAPRAADTSTSARTPPAEPRLLAASRVLEGGPVGAVARRDLRIETGDVGEGEGGATLTIDAPAVRALVASPRASRDRAELAFVYRGPTRADIPLANGEHRRQIGLKLRARDTCNLVYVMWHVAPPEGVVVQVKSNPGKATHAECKDGGYHTLPPSVRRDDGSTAGVPSPALVAIGERHVLAAALVGTLHDRLVVTADGRVVFDATLPHELVDGLDGPVGIRSDNGVFTFTLVTGETAAVHGNAAAP